MTLLSRCWLGRESRGFRVERGPGWFRILGNARPSVQVGSPCREFVADSLGDRRLRAQTAAARPGRLVPQRGAGERLILRIGGSWTTRTIAAVSQDPTACGAQRHAVVLDLEA